MQFMSPAHCAEMNRRLSAAPEVAAACGRLALPMTVQYELSEGPLGKAVIWVLRFAETLSFHVIDGAVPERPDVLIRGDWRRMVRAARAQRNGESLDPQITIEGMDAWATVAPILTSVLPLATVEVDFPDV